MSNRSAGRDLGKAHAQAGEYFGALPERERPRYILVSDFQNFELHDLHELVVIDLSLADLPVHAERSEARSTLDQRCHHGADADVRNGNGPRRRPAARKTKRSDEALWSGCAFSIT